MTRKMFAKLLMKIQGYCRKHIACSDGCIFNSAANDRCWFENATCGIPEDWDDFIEHIKTKQIIKEGE